LTLHVIGYPLRYYPIHDLYVMQKEKNIEKYKIKAAIILGLIAIVVAKFDNGAYLYYLHKKGLVWNWYVGFDEWIGYLKTTYGLIFTLGWMIPGLLAFLILWSFDINLKNKK